MLASTLIVISGASKLHKQMLQILADLSGDRSMLIIKHLVWVIAECTHRFESGVHVAVQALGLAAHVGAAAAGDVWPGWHRPILGPEAGIPEGRAGRHWQRPQRHGLPPQL